MPDPVGLADLVAIDTADVYKGERLAGALHRVGPGVEFRYLPGYDGPGVASTLPQGERWSAGPPGAVPPFFAGLLPEGRRLTLLQRALKTSADDELTQLLAVGGDTVGDVRVVPAGHVPVSPAPRYDRDASGDVRFADLLEASARVVIDRVGLPGVQPKVSARMQTLPVRTAGRLSDAILKLDVSDLPLLPQNEAACLDEARRAGLRVPRHELVGDAEGRTALLVERFDRRSVGGDLLAIAQEDACQVLGLYPADKYRPALETTIAALAAVCPAPKVAALRLWEQVVFSYLVSNGDLHAKNLSVRRGTRGWEPTPVYDVVCTFVYGDTSTMALPLLRETNWDRINRAVVVRAAAATGVPPAAMERSIDRLLQRTAEVPERLATVGFRSINPRKLVRVLERRRHKMA
jgi:serine/threonine-protein kinase HipA